MVSRAVQFRFTLILTPTVLTMLLDILSSLLVVLIHGVLTTAMLQKRQH